MEVNHSTHWLGFFAEPESCTDCIVAVTETNTMKAIKLKWLHVKNTPNSFRCLSIAELHSHHIGYSKRRCCLQSVCCAFPAAGSSSVQPATERQRHEAVAVHPATAAEYFAAGDDCGSALPPYWNSTHYVAMR